MWCRILVFPRSGGAVPPQISRKDQFTARPDCGKILLNGERLLSQLFGSLLLNGTRGLIQWINEGTLGGSNRGNNLARPQACPARLVLCT